jgi:cob(I)alamin adenosyltransferase
MVKLNKIYTRTGDKGTTGLGTGDRVSKASIRVAAYGEVDEANSAVGLAVAMGEPEGSGAHAAAIVEVLRSVQHDLFDVGADLCIPKSADEKPGVMLRVTAAQSARLEPIIDEFNGRLGSLNSFVLPGGRPLAAGLHVARAAVRRAERAAVALVEVEPEATSMECVRYLNRLSDLLFVLARAANDDGARDVLWIKGANVKG